MTELLVSGIFLSVSQIFFSKYDLSASYLDFKTNPRISITLATNISYTVFLTTSCFTASLNLLTSTGTGTNLSICNLSTSVFKLARFDFSAKLEVSIPVASFKSAFVS